MDGGLAAILTAVTSGLALLFGAWWANRKTVRADTIKEWQDLTTRLEAQGERHTAVIEEQARAIRTLDAAHGECREETVELRTCLHYVLDALRRYRASLIELGHDPGPLPEMPAPRMRTDPDFVARQAAQSAQLVREAARTIPPAPGVTPPPGPSP